MSKANNNSSIEHLKKAYNHTDIPPVVYRRILSKIRPPIVGAPEVGKHSLRRPTALAVLAICWFGAVTLLFLYYGQKLKNPVGLRDENPLAARVVRAYGRAEVFQKGAIHSAKIGMHIAEQSTLKTYGNTATLEIGKHHIEVDKDTSFGIRRVTKKKMSFQLTEGAASFHVVKLPKNTTLTVQSGEVRISVVGTVFRVNRAELCTVVSVQEGRIKAEFEDQTVYVSEGGQEKFCEGRPENVNSPREAAPKNASSASDDTPLSAEENKDKAPVDHTTIDRNNARAVALPAAKPRRSPKNNFVKQQASLPPSANGGATIEKAPTTEEQLIQQAHQAIARTNRQEALSHLKTYIDKYPNGLFIEEALFNAVRQSHWLRQKENVIRYSGIFLERDLSKGFKWIEIRIIRAQALLELNRNPEEALASLKPVMSRLDTISDRYRGQSMYLYILASHRAGHKETCASYVEKYLQHFPEGRYRDAIEKLHKK